MRSYPSKKLGLVAGIDEVGRGCLAGPVCAAAVIFPHGTIIDGINDSKQLSEAQRNLLSVEIKRQSLAFSIAMVPPARIDEVNILQATFDAMHHAIRLLQITPDCLLVDGNRFRPFMGITHQCIIGGDAKYMSIAAASIIAKTARDNYMIKLHETYPEYLWHKNKGYPTFSHKAAIMKFGLCTHHRKSFKI